uniref:Uncharacterized protein n=1 Tax=Anguilla anguilla TaxID=7936 RepID=A0A0E9U7U5_ANGAN
MLDYPLYIICKTSCFIFIIFFCVIFFSSNVMVATQLVVHSHFSLSIAWT